MSKILTSLLDRDLSYCDPGLKNHFHLSAMKVLRGLAKELGLSMGQYSIRSNKGGIAVSGEVTLHTDTGLYVQVGQSCLGPGHEVMYRTCSGRSDFSGGRNNFAPSTVLEDLPAFAATLRRLLK